MHGPLVSGWLLAALCGASGLVCLARARRGGPAQREAAGCEALMSLAMAVTAPPTTTLTSLLPTAVPGGLFAVVALWALAQLRHGTHLGHWLLHTAGAAAMAWSALGGHPGHGGTDEAAAPGAGAQEPLLAGLLCCFAAQVLLAGRRLLPRPADPPSRTATALPVLDRPETVTACRVAAAVQMLVMLCRA